MFILFLMIASVCAVSWPRGRYSLPTSKSGCPLGWAEGCRYQDNEDIHNVNDVSYNHHFYGIFGRNTKLCYCTKTSYSGSESWPSGNYCIARYGRSCPSGFRTGSIYWDDEDHDNANTKNGILPDGTYNRNTRIYYCCRSDGPSYRSIVLPTSRPFYLYHYTSTLCQRVRGMSAREEFVKTDDEDTHNNSADGGNHPKKTETTRIHYYCSTIINGYLPNPNDCSSFIQCGHGISYTMPCPTGLHWNRRINVCDWPSNAGCVIVSWPRGRYSLPKSKSGCPVGWAEGCIYQDNEDIHNVNDVRYNHHFYGIFGKNTKLCYCTKTKYGGLASWPRGNYCIARKGGSCPSGFRTGSIYWDDEDHNNANSKNGILPDGTYNRNTRIYYCCRSDGPSYKSIVLPTSKPFYLYHYTSTLCQRVRGMSAREEFVKTDDEDIHNNTSYDGGSHPKKTERTRIYYCYYS
ncbi:unnamed protein product [Mytilus edulis]|uniref:Chitin-binding type-2 domain-containing protein n=1 Tax=Mytilus edulis TaxID=6550 RepID=A0A8S3S2R3_MYTED|nr:unnamed protein product [Mytilus edulis]